MPDAHYRHSLFRHDAVPLLRGRAFHDTDGNVLDRRIKMAAAAAVA